MKTEGQNYLKKLADSPSGFEIRFAAISTRSGLGETLNGAELALLCGAAFQASLCYIAFNGLGGCRGEIRPNQELNRIMLEREYMALRDRFYASVGTKVLSREQKAVIEGVFLKVFVAEENLAAPDR